MKKLIIYTALSLMIFCLYMSPHILYLLTHDVVYYTDDFGGISRLENGMGFEWNKISIFLFLFSSIAFGIVLGKRLLK
jgi:hypothetical protein